MKTSKAPAVFTKCFGGRFLFPFIHVLFKTPCIFIYLFIIIFFKCFRFIILFLFQEILNLIRRDFPAFLKIYCFSVVLLCCIKVVFERSFLGLLGVSTPVLWNWHRVYFFLFFCKTKHHYVITCYTREFDGNLLDFYLYSLVK